MVFEPSSFPTCDYALLSEIVQLDPIPLMINRGCRCFALLILAPDSSCQDDLCLYMPCIAFGKYATVKGLFTIMKPHLHLHIAHCCCTDVGALKYTYICHLYSLHDLYYACPMSTCIYSCRWYTLLTHALTAINLQVKRCPTVLHFGLFLFTLNVMLCPLICFQYIYQILHFQICHDSCFF